MSDLRNFFPICRRNFPITPGKDNLSDMRRFPRSHATPRPRTTPRPLDTARRTAAAAVRRSTVAALATVTAAAVSFVPSAAAHVPSTTGTTTAATVATAAPAATVSAPTRGTVISSSVLPDDLVLTRSSGGWHFEYETDGPHGEKASSLGTLYLPQGQAPEGGWPVLVYGHGTQGLGDANVSWTGWVGEDNTGDQYLAHWLDAGFAVAAPEYVGLGTDGVHPYLNTHSEGAAMIDIVRASRSLSDDLSTAWVTNGYSQGGHASMAAAEMAAEYAPELHLAAVTAGGVPAGIADELAVVTPVLQFSQPDLETYLAFMLAGFRAARPDFPLDDYLTDTGRRIVDLAETADYFEMSDAVADIPVGDLVTRPLATGDLLPAVREHLAVPVDGYDAPVFIYQQAYDMVSPAPFTARLVAEAEANGMDVTYRVDEDPAGHAGWTDGLEDAVAFASSRV